MRLLPETRDPRRLGDGRGVRQEVLPLHAAHGGTSVRPPHSQPSSVHSQVVVTAKMQEAAQELSSISSFSPSNASSNKETPGSRKDLGVSAPLLHQPLSSPERQGCLQPFLLPAGPA